MSNRIKEGENHPWTIGHPKLTADTISPLSNKGGQILPSSECNADTCRGGRPLRGLFSQGKIGPL